PDWRKKTEGKEAVLQRVLPERVGRASAPRPLIPKGKMTRQEIIERFKKTKASAAAFIKSTDVPLKAYTFDNPFPVFGTLSAYDWMLYIPLHTTRHLKQMREVKSTPNYPR